MIGDLWIYTIADSFIWTTNPGWKGRDFNFIFLNFQKKDSKKKMKDVHSEHATEQEQVCVKLYIKSVY